MIETDNFLKESTIHFGHNLLKTLIVYFSRLYFSWEDERYGYIISWHNKGAVFKSMFLLKAKSCVISLTTIFCVLPAIDMVRVYRSILEILYFDKVNIGPLGFHIIYLLNIQAIKLNVIILVKSHVDRAR